METRTSPRIAAAPAAPDEPIGIYLHVPFCAHICPYCDFNTYAGAGQMALVPRYVAAMGREIARQGEEHGHPAAGTIFIGGGTPSLLTPDQIGEVIAACRDAFDLLPGAEVTMEANPNGLDAATAAGFAAAGVTRLSLGVQTVHRRGLRTLGRQHEADDARAAYVAARQAGFTSVSLDLIFGWPGQTLDGWRDDLDAVLAWPDGGPDHLSLYSLIVEPGTPFADAVARGILRPLDDDASADLYELAMARLDEAGFEHYEVANWARTPADRSRHNVTYWRNGSWAGIGAGAHGQWPGRREMEHLLPRTFIEAIEAGQSPVSNLDEVTPRMAMGETMMLGLRLIRDGVGEGAFAARHGVGLAEAFGPTIDDLAALGLLERDAGRVRLTPRGLMVANDVCARFL
ncbi:MAG: radical SAM family heme chaperone HemW [Chloroflexia bacterium]|nr:radical SAM family heme chaperone HemW [Chloroflexia bacterium]MDQ3513942.1 radical SAM family heme chaperone HemW [Chloroflexota bacterium]